MPVYIRNRVSYVWIGWGGGKREEGVGSAMHVSVVTTALNETHADRNFCLMMFGLNWFKFFYYCREEIKIFMLQLATFCK